MAVTDVEAIFAASPPPSASGGEPVEPIDAFPERLGDFHLIRRLGAGDRGVVFLARQESLSRDVALKVVRPDCFPDPEARDRFLHDVEAASRLGHPGIVQVFGAGEESGLLWVAMEVVEGCTLAEALDEMRASGRERSAAAFADAVRAIARRKSSRNSEGAAREVFAGSWVQGCVRLVRDVARALDHAHRRGVLHRALSPSNILIDLRGRARLIDFGDASPEGIGRLPSQGARLGSLPYMAPEQLRRRAREIDERTDVYALGVTLYQLLTLELPFHDADPRRTRALALDGEPLPLHELVPGIPWDVETVCLAAMERDRARRYPSAEVFARELDSLLAARPIEARRAGPSHRARRWIARHATVSVAVAVLLALLVTAPALLLVAVQAERDQLAAANRLLQQQMERVQLELDAERARARRDGR